MNKSRATLRRFGSAERRRKEGIKTEYEIKETLKKQLQLLSERSEKTESNKDLADITHAMCEVTDRLLCNDNPYDFSSSESNV